MVSLSLSLSLSGIEPTSVYKSCTSREPFGRSTDWATAPRQVPGYLKEHNFGLSQKEVSFGFWLMEVKSGRRQGFLHGIFLEDYSWLNLVIWSISCVSLDCRIQKIEATAPFGLKKQPSRGNQLFLKLLSQKIKLKMGRSSVREEESACLKSQCVLWSTAVP